MTIQWIFPVLVASTTSLFAVSAAADDSDEIRRLARDGRILTLEELLERHRDRIGGRLLDLDLERDDGRIIYEMEVIDDDGRIREIEIDAVSGEWISEEIED